MEVVISVQNLAEMYPNLTGPKNQPPDLNSLAADTGITQPTAREWLSVLEGSFIVHRLAPPSRCVNEPGQGECRYLSTEVGGLFTGVYFALYATGSGSDSTTPAHFDYADYREYGDLQVIPLSN